MVPPLDQRRADDLTFARCLLAVVDYVYRASDAAHSAKTRDDLRELAASVLYMFEEDDKEPATADDDERVGSIAERILHAEDYSVSALPPAHWTEINRAYDTVGDASAVLDLLNAARGALPDIVENEAARRLLGMAVEELTDPRRWAL